MGDKHTYYMKLMKLLEGRAKRLNELLEVAAPTDLICREIKLLADIAIPLSPNIFKSKDTKDEKAAERLKCATG